MDSFIGRIGGKKRLRDEILSRFPQAQPERYIEVFGGAGWVLFRKEKLSGQMEVFNDLDRQLINLFRCVKHHREELQKELEWLPSSRVLFNDSLKMVDLEGLTDIQRAARYLYLVKISFGTNARTFATTSKRITKVADYLEAVQQRLESVVIECKDFENLIKVYDRPGALFYLDPPYVGTEKLYTVPFGETDHRRLAETLRGIKGKFILSYNDCDFVRELYAGCNIEAVERSNMLAAKGNNRGIFREVIICNYFT